MIMVLYVDNLLVNHVFYADDLCLMAPCAIALQQLLNICYRYRIIVDLNLNALKSLCFAFTPKPCKLCLPSLHKNNIPLVYVDYTISAWDIHFLKIIRMTMTLANKNIVCSI